MALKFLTMKEKLFWKLLMRVDIVSKNKFNSMLKELFRNSSIPFITGCSIDSKNINPGDIFFPLKGKQFDGHDFIEEAVENGASLIVSDQEIDSKFQAINISVDDVSRTIKYLANKWRNKTNCIVIGITGSNGKTSTKEILNRTLSKSKAVMFSRSNYNSTIGLPMSIFSISMDDEISILEMGANKNGEIKELAEIANPNHGLITNISNAHNEYFGSIENIAKNKLELLKSIPKSGYAFINMDDPYIKKVALDCKYITYGFTGNYDFNGKILNKSIKINGNIIKLPYCNMAIAQNYLAAYSISSTFGIDDKDIINRLETSPIYPGRGELVEKYGAIFINDSYNSNFASCSNGINSIIKMTGNKKILVLGDMHELGDKTEEEHVKLGKLIDSTNIDALFALGKYMKFTVDAIKSNKIFKKHCNNKTELIDMLMDYKNNGDIIYIKGSRCMKMEDILKGTWV